MDKDTKFALLVIGVPFLGLLYCGLILAVMMASPAAREHPIATGAFFAVFPSLISGVFWLKSSIKFFRQKGLRQSREGE